ncbi:hypothetical protein ACQFX9_05465 [Aliinostoc sp. HNIBRCY26]|uniref:hypothetical protein n=1 Tax=Aliinostoc sp. HNIBRCY26 TaxID=3418997 RepID=UPI003D06C5D4
MFVKSYHRIQQSLQWWSLRQSLKLFMEAEKIREELLQELFTFRRNLELSALDNEELSSEKTQAYVQQIDYLHRSLAKLSDRLFPSYLQDNFPLAIEDLLEQWIVSHPHLEFHLSMPFTWRYESAEHSLIVLNALEELFTITLPDLLTPRAINISLEQRQNLAQLIVTMTYSDISMLVPYTHWRELDYLCESFRALTAGKLFYRRNNLMVAYYFYW